MKTPKENQRENQRENQNENQNTSKGGSSTTSRDTSASRDKQVDQRTTKGPRRENSSSNGDLFTDLGISKNTFWGILGAVAGSALLYRGTRSSNKSKVNPKSIIEVKTSMLIKRPKEELYDYWRNLENLPNFMSHLESVTEYDEKRSEWVAEIPGGVGHIEWESEITWEHENQILAWRSLPDSDIENSGEVRFEPVGRGKKTIVEVTISYRPPAGKAGGLAAKLLNPAFKKVVENDLKEFKNIMEKGGKAKKRSLKSRENY